jgi:predicted RNA-binding protein YlxR (DUF448 family)
MAHLPQRTCIGCRGVFRKNDVVRVVSGPDGALIDYREKLPGRAAYVCARRECIQKALAKGVLSRALRANTRIPPADVFLARLRGAVTEKIKSLVAMAARAGMLAAGFSAVEDALGKNRAQLLIFSPDISPGTRERIEGSGNPLPSRRITVLSRDELGQVLGRELVGVAAVLDEGFADALWREAERLKGLLNAGE